MKQWKETINIPITISWFRSEDEKQAKALLKLIEYQLLQPEYNRRLEDIVQEAKDYVLTTWSPLPPTTEAALFQMLQKPKDETPIPDPDDPSDPIMDAMTKPGQRGK